MADGRVQNERLPLRGGEPPLFEHAFKVDAADAARHRRLKGARQ